MLVVTVRETGQHNIYLEIHYIHKCEVIERKHFMNISSYGFDCIQNLEEILLTYIHAFDAILIIFSKN